MSNRHRKIVSSKQYGWGNQAWGRFRWGGGATAKAPARGGRTLRALGFSRIFTQPR